MAKIEEIMDLIEETGEKCFILKNESAFVLLNLEDYCRLAGLTTQKNIKKQGKVEKSGLTQPNNDIRVYEIPRLKDEEDGYFPEHLG